jgi:hypothetical protein
LSVKYLFRAYFEDGTQLDQPPDDSSAIDPQRSASYDLRVRSQGDALAQLVLLARSGRAVASVHQKTGLFMISGLGFLMPGAPLPKGFAWVEGDPAQGSYYRTHRHHLNLVEGQTVHEVAFVIGTKAEAGVRNFLEVS